jgi:DNA-binding transcriptional LysR family regulator
MDKRRSPRLSLDLLRSFHAAARHLSFTRAAQELFLTQSAVSRGIKSLEEQLGQPLFRRVHRALELTPAGQQLFQTTEEVFVRINDTADRLVNSGKVLSITTTTSLASLWLAPRLPRFNRLHPSIDVRIVASNDKPDLERDQLDIAIRLVLQGADTPDCERLFDCYYFPICSPALARDQTQALRTPADLARHVRLDLETIRDGRPWSQWDMWFSLMKIPVVNPAGTLRYSHYDQVIPAAIDSYGVAIGMQPHLTQYFSDGVLCAPLGPDAMAHMGSFFIVIRPDVAGRDITKTFVAWLRSEVRRDNELALAVSHPPAKVSKSPVRRISTRAS